MESWTDTLFSATSIQTGIGDWCVWWEYRRVLVVSYAQVIDYDLGMTWGIDTGVILATIAAATFLRAMVGFGDALVAMPILALLIPIGTAIPLVSLVTVSAALMIAQGDWRYMDRRALKPMLLAAVPGTCLGIFGVHRLDETVAKLLLGCVVLGFAACNLFRRSEARLRDDRQAAGYGFVAGVLGAAYNTPGPPLAIYGSLRGWSPSVFRATIQGYFLPTGVLIVAQHAVLDHFTQTIFWHFAAALPLMAVAVWAGRRVSRDVPKSTFRRAVDVLLILTGSALIWQAV